MKRIILQYFALGASLASMLFAISYIRGMASEVYLAQMGIFLVLLSWATPFESSIGNLIINAARKRLLGNGLLSRFDLQMIIRSLVLGFCFTLAFYYYPTRELLVYPQVAVYIGVLFFLRLLEYVLKTRLLLVHFGQEAQIVINCFTAIKWLVASWILCSITSSFTAFVFVHVGFGLCSVLLLSLALWKVKPVGCLNGCGNKSVNIGDDVVSILGVGIGVFSYQLDKLGAGHFYDSAQFGEYVSVFTIAFIVHYLLNPVFIVILQRLTAMYSQMDHGVSRQIDRSKSDFAILRLLALGVGLATLILLGPSMNLFSKPLSQVSYINIAYFVFASYLNCIAHIYYLDYLARGALVLILLQNITAALFAIAVFLFLWSTGGATYAMILVAAGVGQCVYGMARRLFVEKIGFDILEHACTVILALFLLIYIKVLAVNGYSVVLFFSGLLLYGIAIHCEARLLRVSLKNLFSLVLQFPTKADLQVG